MSDYRVNIKIRNARLLRAIEHAGHRPGKKFSELVGISYYSLLDFLRLRGVPFYENGDLSRNAEKLCVFLNRMPSDLWSEDQMTPIANNSAHIEMSGEEVARLISLQDVPILTSSQDDILEMLQKKENTAALDDLLETLTTRERRIIRQRLGFDGPPATSVELSNAEGISSARILQIESKALRKMRRRAGKPEFVDRFPTAPEEEEVYST